MGSTRGRFGRTHLVCQVWHVVFGEGRLSGEGLSEEADSHSDVVVWFLVLFVGRINCMYSLDCDNVYEVSG